MTSHQVHLPRSSSLFRVKTAKQAVILTSVSLSLCREPSSCKTLTRLNSFAMGGRNSSSHVRQSSLGLLVGDDFGDFNLDGHFSTSVVEIGESVCLVTL